MRFFYIIFSLLFIFGCQSSKSPVKSSSDPKASYDRSTAAADAAQRELECESTGNCPVPKVVSTTKPSGNVEYDRAQLAADKAFNELDCEIKGTCIKPKDTIQEKSKPTPDNKPTSTIENKPRPNVLVEKGMDKSSKYPMLDGKPVWYSDPSYGGYIGGVGVARQQKGGYPAQRRVAQSLAQADLARSVKINVSNELVLEKLLVDTKASSSYEEKMRSMSRQEAEGYINNPSVMDEWSDPSTGELYIWVVLPR